jgi:hypothetical protein
MGPMRNTRHCSAVIAALTIVASTTISLGQVAPQPVTGNEFAAATNMLHRGMKVEGRLFVPATATRIRAVTVLIDYGNTWRLYQSEIWRKSAESTESALLLARVSSFNVIPPTPYPPERQVMRVASLGGSEGLLTVMQRLATESGHPDVCQGAPTTYSRLHSVSHESARDPCGSRHDQGHSCAAPGGRERHERRSRRHRITLATRQRKWRAMVFRDRAQRPSWNH